MANVRKSRYLIEVKDSQGKSVFHSAAYWDEKDKRVAIAQLMRLADLPDVNFYTGPALQPDSDEDKPRIAAAPVRRPHHTVSALRSSYRPALRVNLIVEGECEQPTGPSLLGRPPLLAEAKEPGASLDAYQFRPYVCLPDRDGHSTFRRSCFPVTTSWRARASRRQSVTNQLFAFSAGAHAAITALGLVIPLTPSAPGNRW